MTNRIGENPMERNIQKPARADGKEFDRAKGVKRVGIFTCFLIIVGLLAFVFGLTEALVSSAQLKSDTYKNAVKLYREYNDLHNEYLMIDLNIAQRHAETESEDKKIKDYWRERRKQNEAEWNKQWEGFSSLVAYYSQSAESYEMLTERTDEYRRLDGKYSSLVTRIENQTEERNFVGTVFMGIGGALLAIGFIKLLRDLQLLGRFSRLTKYRTFVIRQ